MVGEERVDRLSERKVVRLVSMVFPELQCVASVFVHRTMFDCFCKRRLVGDVYRYSSRKRINGCGQAPYLATWGVWDDLLLECMLQSGPHGANPGSFGTD